MPFASQCSCKFASPPVSVARSMARRSRQAGEVPRARCGWRVIALFVFAFGWLGAGASWFAWRMSAPAGKSTAPALGIKSVPLDNPGRSQQLCVIVRTMPSQRFALPALLLSLFSDNDTRRAVRALVINTETRGGAFDDLAAIVASVNAVIGFEGVMSSSRQQADIPDLFPQLKSPDYGYLLTDAALEDVIAAFQANSDWARRRKPLKNTGRLHDPKSRGVSRKGTPVDDGTSSAGHVLLPLMYLMHAGWTCEFVMATNGDNVYTAEFMRAVLDSLEFPVPARPALALAGSRSFERESTAGESTGATGAGGATAPGPAATTLPVARAPTVQPISRATVRVSGSPGHGASMVATHWCVTHRTLALSLWPTGRGRVLRHVHHFRLCVTYLSTKTHSKISFPPRPRLLRRFSHYRLSTADMSYKKMLRADRCGPLHTGRFAESVVSQVLRPGCVDLGAVAVRTEVLAATGARFFADALREDPKGLRPLTSSEGCAGHQPAYCADGALFSRLAATVRDDAGLVIVRAPLYFHQ